MQTVETQKIIDYLKDPSILSEIINYEQARLQKNFRSTHMNKKFFDFLVFYNPKLLRPMLICKMDFGKTVELVVYDVLNPELPNKVEYQDIGMLRMNTEIYNSSMKIDLLSMEHNLLNEADYKFMGIGGTMIKLSQHIMANKEIDTLEIQAGAIGSLSCEEVERIYTRWGFKSNIINPGMHKAWNQTDIQALKNTPISTFDILPLESLTPETLEELSDKAKFKYFTKHPSPIYNPYIPEQETPFKK
ncbi:MAG: hypothetical protein LBN07_03615 [Christensenellaceae bacterium]|jgi:hypothetical protein|nr:hypothetical protein [Christensenellaceae bacterium]